MHGAQPDAGDSYRAAPGASRRPEVSRLLVEGSLDHLLRYVLTRCERSAHIAARLLEALADAPEIHVDTRGLCRQASARLADRPDSLVVRTHV